MSLRDWFAGQADAREYDFPDIAEAAAFLGEEQPDHTNMVALISFSIRLQARLQYMIADAMLAERETD
jgi:hypothetical protein